MARFAKVAYKIHPCPTFSMPITTNFHILCISKSTYSYYLSSQLILIMCLFRQSIECYNPMLRESNESSNTAIKQSTEESRIEPTLPQVIYARDSSDCILVGREDTSAFPQSPKPFYKLAPFCLWDSFRQPHILYYLCCGVLEYFKFCSLRQGEIFGTSVQMILVILCLAFQVNARYTTYRQYAAFLPEESLGTYRAWNRAEDRWEDVDGSELCMGQVVIVQKYLQSNPKLNPANLLPLAFASGSKTMLVKSTRIDKKEDYSKVKIVKALRNMVVIDQQGIHINPDLFSLSIQYRFISKLGSTFEAVLCFDGHTQEEAVISNSDILPRGIPISIEQFVVGIVLRHTESFQTSNAANSITKSNKINLILHRYLFLVIVLNIFLMVCIFVINMILTTVTTEFDSSNYGSYFYCFTINLCANLCNVIYIGMYLLIYIHRAIDLRIMARKYKLTFKNSIKSLDQLAQTDTLIMDDYFFIDKAFDPDRFHFIANPEAPLQCNLNLILKVIEESPLLKEHMLGHTGPIGKYFRIKKLQCERKAKVKILRQAAIDQSTMQVTIKVILRNAQSRYLVRFSDKPIASTIHKIRDNTLRTEMNRLIYKSEQSNALMLFVQILQVEGSDLEMSKSNQSMDFYAAFSFSQQLSPSSLSVIRSQAVLRKYNVVILSSKTWKYINYFMEKASMKNSSDLVIALEEKEEKEMHHILRNYRSTLKKAELKDSHKKKSAILFLNSNMITYLSRKVIRKSIFKLAVYCKYIVFYSCSQYQKQISAVNVFKIFPDHIFLCNYICDFDILQYSSLSICQRGASSQMLTTIVVNRYKNLETIIFQQAIKSIQIIYCIINSCTFKNQLFLISDIVVFLCVYRGSMIQMGISYSSQIYFFYNFVFTIIPIVVMIVRRPGLYIDEDVRQYLNVADMLMMNIKTIIFGGVTAYFTYNLLTEQFVANTFTAILINCIITSNLFLLFLDDSYHKKWQVGAIAVQIVISLILIVMVQLYDAQSFQFVEIGTNFDPGNIWFYFTTFLIIPVISILVIFAFSAGREIKVMENSRELVLREWSERIESGESNTEQNLSEVVLKVPKSKGKQLSFEEEDCRLLD